MNQVVAVRPGDMDATVQPGVTWNELNEHLAETGTGMFFAMDPGPGASVGGMVATGCSGTNAVRFGTMKANVLNVTVRSRNAATQWPGFAHVHSPVPVLTPGGPLSGGPGGRDCGEDGSACTQDERWVRCVLLTPRVVPKSHHSQLRRRLAGTI